ncbi:caspase-8 [Morone saxatilis]|uniref:caspase-8 n=1 Tax=Morone saxatilis TaxID=34816 RepID=UPI0015E24EB3|nr:caspase-8 [Morone saxatilis]
MDRLMLAHIDEELVSSEVEALCFLCQGLIQRKRLEGVKDAKTLFVKLEEKGLLDNPSLLYQLLRTIKRADLLSLLETDSRRPEETDANPILSDYRVMLYQIHEDMTEENLGKMKFLLSSKLGKRQIETCNTALDVFVEMEKAGLLSETNLDELHETLLQLDQQQALTVQRYKQRGTRRPQTTLLSRVSMDYQPTQPVLSISEMYNDFRPNVYSDAEPNSLPKSLPLFDPKDYYVLAHIPHGMCVIFNNENFSETSLNYRRGSQQDEKSLLQVFTTLGFTVVVHHNLSAECMQRELEELGQRNFLNDDALVVCLLSHGDKGCVFGTDGQKVFLQDVTKPFTSGQAPTLAGKPKLFFIQACQGNLYQRGSVPCPPRPRQEEGDRESRLEEDAGPVHGETVPHDADFLLGMATVPECRSFRNTSTGSIYIQQLCRELLKSAESSERDDDILTVLTRVNREVSKGEYLTYKQMPEPKYTLTKKLVLKCV